MGGFETIGKLMMVLGAALLLLGGLLWLVSKIPFLGHLPGGLPCKYGFLLAPLGLQCETETSPSGIVLCVKSRCLPQQSLSSRCGLIRRFI